jgi:SAM-dependent methyltransferase
MGPGAESPIDLAGDARVRVPPIVVALTAQSLAWGLCRFVFGDFVGGGFAFALASGLLAAGIAATFRMAPWWIPGHAVFPAAVLLTSRLSVDPLWFLGAFVLLLAVYGSTFRTQVPLYLSNARAIDAIAARLPGDRPFRFLDLGCGTGSVIAPLSRAFDRGEFVGVELAWIPCLIAKLRARLGGNRHRTERTDLFTMDLSQFDVVYAFLSPVPMPELWRKARAEMRPGSLFVSNTFTVPGVPADETVHVGPGQRSLHVWRM